MLVLIPFFPFPPNRFRFRLLNSTTADEKAPFEKQAQADKVRYADQIKSYKGGPAGAGDGDAE